MILNSFHHRQLNVTNTAITTPKMPLMSYSPSYHHHHSHSIQDNHYLKSFPPMTPNMNQPPSIQLIILPLNPHHNMISIQISLTPLLLHKLLPIPPMTLLLYPHYCSSPTLPLHPSQLLTKTLTYVIL